MTTSCRGGGSLRSHRAPCLILLFLQLVGFLPPSSLSAHMVALGTEELTRRSELVLEGTVEETGSMWSRDGKTIVTRATVLVRGVIRGAPVQARVVVEHEGGEVGRLGLAVSDVAQMAKGEHVILFLREGESPAGGTVFRTVGKAQGKYTVGKDGMARKQGFSVGAGREAVDAEIPVDVLIEKIKSVR